MSDDDVTWAYRQGYRDGSEDGDRRVKELKEHNASLYADAATAFRQTVESLEHELEYLRFWKEEALSLHIEEPVRYAAHDINRAYEAKYGRPLPKSHYDKDEKAQ